MISFSFANLLGIVSAMNRRAKLYQLPRKDRLERLHQEQILSDDDVQLLKKNELTQFLSCADLAIENSIGVFGMPLGIVPNVHLPPDNQPLILATEETSVLAALNRGAKWANQSGAWSFAIEPANMLGHIAFSSGSHPSLHAFIDEQKKSLIAHLNTTVARNMKNRGGGVQNLRLVAVSDKLSTVELHFNPCEAMGANALNQTLSALQKIIEQKTQLKALSAILSNRMLPNARAELKLNNVDEKLGTTIAELSNWAQNDPNRAVTHNKGIMNAIDGILIATGNDWRAVSSSCHAWASQSGCYQGLSQWSYKNQQLTGRIELPLQIGVIGGMTTVHPMAKLCMNVMKIQSREQLSKCVLAAGLLQNLSALRALASEGIVPGHMQLHIENILQQSAVQPEHWERVRLALKSHLQKHGHISPSIAQKLSESS